MPETAERKQDDAVVGFTQARELLIGTAVHEFGDVAATSGRQEALLDPHAIRIKRHRRGPVAEHAEDADVFGQHVDHAVQVTFACDG
jgi:hypothetical protein